MSSVLPEDRRALVAIDLGAESCRVSLLRWVEGGPRVELVRRFANDAVLREDGLGVSLHWDLAGILRGLEAGLRRCAEIATEGIRSIGVDGWAADYVRLDANGEAIGDPFCYRDERTAAGERSLHQRISAERMRELTGLQLLPLNTVYQIHADCLASDGTVPHGRWLNLPEYVLHWLGGRAVSERTNASHTQMVGLDGRWSEEIFAAAGADVRDAPEIVEPGTDVGPVSAALAKLPAFAATRLIAPACHDTASAIAAVPDGGDDWAYISSGTWSLVGTVLDAPMNSDAAKAENFTNLAGVDGTICFHKNVNGMWLLRQCLETWKAQGVELDLVELVRAASLVPAVGYALDVDEAELLLPGDMPARINAQLRRRGLAELSVAPADGAAMASFLFRSLASRYATVLAKIAAITGKQLRTLYILGGGSQNEFLNWLTAEATGLAVCRAGTECSTVGNFAVQLALLEPVEGPRPAAVWAGRLAV